MLAFFSRKRRWFAGAFAGLALAVGIYALAGFYLAPYLIQTQVWPMLSEKTGGHFQAERTEFNPFALSLAMSGFSLKGPDNAEVASIGELNADVDAWASIKSKSLVADAKITQPSLNILFDRQGNPNFGFLLPKEEKPKEQPPSSTFPFLLTLLDIKQGRLAFEDLSRGAGFKKVLSPLNFTLANLGTSSATAASFKLYAEDDGRQLISTAGDLHFEQTTVDGEFELQDLKLAPLAAWLVSDQGYVVLDGLLSIKLKYRYGKEANFEIPSLEAVINGLSLAKEGQPFLEVGTITTHELSYQLKADQLQLKSLALEKIALKGPAPVDVASVNAQGLDFDVKANQLKLESIGVEKIALKGPASVDVASINAQGLGFDVKANQLKLESIGVEKIALKGPASVDVASVNAQGLGFDVKANQLKLESIGVEKIGLNSPAPADVASISAQGLGFDLNANQLKLESISVEKIGFKSPTPLDVASVNAQELAFDVKANQLQLKSIFLEQIDLKTPTPVREENGKPRLVGIGSLKLDEIAVSIAEKSLHLGKVTTQNAIVAAWLEKDGSLGIPGLPPANSVPPSPAAPAKPAAKESPSDPWKFGADVIELNNNDIALRDFSVDPPVAAHLSPLNLLVKDFSSETGKPFWLGMNTGLTMNGRIALEGKLNLSPPTANLKVYVDDLSLPGLQAYIDQSVRFRVVKGTLNLNADIDFEDKGPPQIRFGGDVAVTNFASDDKREGQDFINFKNLRLNGIIFENTPQRVSIREVIATEPYVRAILDQDKKFNIAENLSPPVGIKALTSAKPDNPDKFNKPEKPDKPSKPSKFKKTGKAAKSDKADKLANVEKKSTEPNTIPVTGGSAKAPMAVVIGVVHIHKATSDFTDMTIKPNNFSVNINNLTGDIRSLSSRQDSKSDVMLEGKLNEGSPAKIYGKVNLFSVKIFTDIVMNFTDVNLTTLSPYFARFAGYRIEKGKLSMDLHYKLDNGQLVAENKFILDQLTLGEQVDSPDATSLPVKLAISLLKDSNGRINLNLPISGDLGNPQIDIWGLLGNAATSLLTKLVTAPFNLLGSLISNGSEEDLGSVKFSPGKADLSEQEKGELGNVAKALQDRPALRLEIKGTAHQTLDRPVMAEQGLTRQLKNTRLFELGKTKVNESEGDELTLNEQDYARLLTNLYRSKNPGSPDLQGVKINEALSGDQLENAKRKLLDQWMVTDGDLRSLAQSRGRSIRDYLIQGQGFSDQRIYLLDVKLLGQEEKEIKTLLTLTGS